MSFFNRYFFAGLAAGVGLTVASIVVAGLLLLLQAKKQVDVLGGELSPPPFPQEESLAHIEWELQSLDGVETSFSAFEGKVLFVNLWATWCGPCVTEMPSIQRLYEQFPREEVAGRIVFRHLGSARWDDESSVRFLNELLAKEVTGGDTT